MLWYVAIGGAAGSVARYLIGTLIQQRVGGTFPLGTLVVNVSGSLLLGVLMEASLASPALTRDARALLATGLCGGFTTFSTFSFESIRLLQDGDHRRAAAYIGLSLALSLLAIVAGFGLARRILA